MVENVKAEKIIIDNKLKPVQAYNLAKLTGIEVIDRYRLILEIFAKRVTSKEAKLQIRLAELQYQLPRARESVRLARMDEQPGFMGLGQYEIDIYYDHVKRQMTQIKQELQKIREKRDLHRTRRLDLGFSLISLAGYTNAGKSTLFNSLTKESTLVGPGLFTTLSTTTRRIKIDGRRVLITDTVGFIDRLPLELIEAFHSTLEETIFSDLILLIMDISEPISDVKRKLRVCLDTIRDIGVIGIPIITVLNKIDLLTDKTLNVKLKQLDDFAPNPIPVSAKKSVNLKGLANSIIGFLEEYIIITLTLPQNSDSMSLLSELYNQADVTCVNYCNDEMTVKLSARPSFIGKIQGRIMELGGNQTNIKHGI